MRIEPPPAPVEDSEPWTVDIVRTRFGYTAHISRGLLELTIATGWNALTRRGIERKTRRVVARHQRWEDAYRNAEHITIERHGA